MIYMKTKVLNNSQHKLSVVKGLQSNNTHNILVQLNYHIMSFSEHQSHLLEIFHIYQTKQIYLYYYKSCEGGVLCIQSIST